MEEMSAFPHTQKNPTGPAGVLRALSPKEERCDTADPGPADLRVCGVAAATSLPLHSRPGQGLGSCFSRGESVCVGTRLLHSRSVYVSRDGEIQIINFAAHTGCSCLEDFLKCLICILTSSSLNPLLTKAWPLCTNCHRQKLTVVGEICENISKML